MNEYILFTQIQEQFRHTILMPPMIIPSLLEAGLHLLQLLQELEVVVQSLPLALGYRPPASVRSWLICRTWSWSTTIAHLGGSDQKHWGRSWWSYWFGWLRLWSWSSECIHVSLYHGHEAWSFQLAWPLWSLWRLAWPVTSSDHPPNAILLCPSFPKEGVEECLQLLSAT